jgi:hypothetical protein
MERYLRGKAYRAWSGSVNVLGGAPFGHRYVRKTPEAGPAARPSIIRRCWWLICSADGRHHR